MSETPVPQEPGRGADPWPEWLDDPACLASRAEDEDPGDLDDYADPDPVRSRRPDLSVQWEPEVPLRPPAQARPQVEGRATPQRRGPVDDTIRAAVPYRADPVPHLTGGVPGRSTVSLEGRHVPS